MEAAPPFSPTCLHVTRPGALGTLTPARPHCLNALSPRTPSQLIEAAHWLDEQAQDATLLTRARKDGESRASAQRNFQRRRKAV